MSRIFRRSLAVMMVLALCSGAAAWAKIRINAQPNGAGMVNLPYGVNDNAGNSWMIYQGGWLREEGNQQVFSQGAMLMINGNQPQQRTNQARIDDKTGEIIFDKMPTGIPTVVVTRRILISKEDGLVRFVDIFKNTAAQDATVNLAIQSNINYGIAASQLIADTRKKDQNIAWVAQTNGSRCPVQMFAGKGAKVVPSIIAQPNNNMVQATLQLPVPANKEVALVHILTTSNSMDDATQLVNNLRESKLLASLPSEIRKIVVNFPGSQSFVGDREILRGTTLDVVELRGGDRVQGTLKDAAFKLTTFYGEIELPAKRVIGMFNVGEFRPRQLIVTVDGEIFGGSLAKQTIDLELSSGQTTQVPLSQMTRLGFRKRSGEPEEWPMDKPFVAMRSGDRVGVNSPANAIDVVTRYGTLKLDPKSVATILFQSDESGVHQVYLTDGSHFAGLASAVDYEMKLSSADQTVKFPASGIARMQIGGPPPDLDEATSPTLKLASDDLLVGTIQGQLKLDTAFDTITISAPEIRKLTRANESASDVQVTLWDQSVVSGQLQDALLPCKLESGVLLSVPVALLEDYDQPLPQPAPAQIDRIKASVKELNAEDWKVRDHAEADLTSMGPAVIGVLKQLRPEQPPEAQQRIDQIISAVTTRKKDASPSAVPPNPAITE